MSGRKCTGTVALGGISWVAFVPEVIFKGKVLRIKCLGGDNCPGVVS